MCRGMKGFGLRGGWISRGIGVLCTKRDSALPNTPTLTTPQTDRERAPRSVGRNPLFTNKRGPALFFLADILAQLRRAADLRRQALQRQSLFQARIIRRAPDGGVERIHDILGR